MRSSDPFRRSPQFLKELSEQPTQSTPGDSLLRINNPFRIEMDKSSGPVFYDTALTLYDRLMLPETSSASNRCDRTADKMSRFICLIF